MRTKLPTLADRGGNWPQFAYAPRDINGVTGATIHYTASPPAEGLGAVRNIAEYQISNATVEQTQAGQPFPAIAYHLVVDKAGVVYLCHDLSVRVWHSGASVAGVARNASHVAICYIGNQAPSAPQITGIGRAIAWCEKTIGRSLTIEGHRDPAGGTTCPGPTWPAWRAAVLEAADKATT